MTDKVTIINKATDKRTGDDISLLMNVTPGNEEGAIHELETLVWQAKETLRALAAKQKIWDQPEVNQVVQQEQESSTQHKDQTLLEKEQSQRTVRTRNKQYIISYPEGESIDLTNGMSKPNHEVTDDMLNCLLDGISISIPEAFKIQVIDL